MSFPRLYLTSIPVLKLNQRNCVKKPSENFINLSTQNFLHSFAKEAFLVTV